MKNMRGWDQMNASRLNARLDILWSSCAQSYNGGEADSAWPISSTVIMYLLVGRCPYGLSLIYAVVPLPL
eukprot:scaffold287206_cov37-Tisochrysis_lutea.AAC.5